MPVNIKAQHSRFEHLSAVNHLKLALLAFFLAQSQLNRKTFTIDLCFFFIILDLHLNSSYLTTTEDSKGASKNNNNSQLF